MLEGIIEMQSFCGTKAIQNKDLRIGFEDWRADKEIITAKYTTFATQ